MGDRCFLTMDLENQRYLGSLLFTDKKFAICKRLMNRTGIKEIGDVDLSYTL